MSKARIWSRRRDDGTWWWYWEIPTGTSASGYQPVTTLLVGNGSSQPQVMAAVSRLLAERVTPPVPALIGTHADPDFVAHQDHKHPVEGCGYCPTEEASDG